MPFVYKTTNFAPENMIVEGLEGGKFKQGRFVSPIYMNYFLEYWSILQEFPT